MGGRPVETDELHTGKERGRAEGGRRGREHVGEAGGGRGGRREQMGDLVRHTQFSGNGFIGALW